MGLCGVECIEKIVNFLEIKRGKLSINERGRVSICERYLFLLLVFSRVLCVLIRTF
jgi:hypothetical protein